MVLKQMAKIKTKGTNVFVKIVLGLVIVYLLYVSADLCIKISEKKSQNNSLREQISIATIENEQLENTKNAEMDAEYIEKVAKEHGYVNSDEKVYESIS